MSWRAQAAAELAQIQAAGRQRRLRVFDARGPVGRLEGREVITFAANDYLGLSAHPAPAAAAAAAIETWGTGAGASRLVTGHRPIHAQLEADLAAWKNSEAALVFPTGYTANLGVLSTFGGSGVTVLSDELNHASIIDGARLSRAQVRVYRHADAAHAAELWPEEGPVMVVTDSIFSMDGDLAPVGELAQLCVTRGGLLVLDEAHAVFPRDERDLADSGAEVLRVGTLSKTLGSQGGFVAGPAEMIQLLVNRARSFIFTTGLSPADAAAARAGLVVLRSSEGDALLSRLRAHVDRLRPDHPSPILPVVLGSEGAALEAADALLAQGLLVPAIRPPTVAPGTSRLRVALSAAHSEAAVEALASALEGLAVPA